MKEKDLLKVFKRFLHYRFNLDDDKAAEEEIVETISKNAEFRGISLWTLIFAIFIASIGLNVNSTAVVIGAMLISPLMGPIMGVGLGLGTFDFELIRRALKNLLIAVGISLLASTLYFLITPLRDARSELLARTTPTIWDVLIALFGGLTGIVAGTRKQLTNAVPGVAIATALMPPLCTAGYGLATGHFSYFIGAFYLFTINSVFITLATFLIVRFLGFKISRSVKPEFESRLRKIVWTIAVCTILPSVYLAYRFVKEEVFWRHASTYLDKEVRADGRFVIGDQVDPQAGTITAVVIGKGTSDSALRAIIEKRKNYGLADATVMLQGAGSINDISKNMNALRSGLSEEFYSQQVNLLSQQNARIDSMEKSMKRVPSDSIVHAKLFSEFTALFGRMKELSVSQTPLLFQNGMSDTAVIVYFVPEEKKNKPDIRQIENWFRVRTGRKEIRVLTGK